MTDRRPVYIHASAAKAAAAMLFVAEELPARWDALYRETALYRRLPVDRLVVALYLADRHSLARFARPIYGETWNAAWHGLDPQIAIDILRNHWSVHRRIPGHTDRTIHMTANADVVHEGRCDRTLLSDTDVESLLVGMDAMIRMERDEIECFHLSDPAWLGSRHAGVVNPVYMITVADYPEHAATGLCPIAEVRREIAETAATMVF